MTASPADDEGPAATDSVEARVAQLQEVLRIFRRERGNHTRLTRRIAYVRLLAVLKAVGLDWQDSRDALLAIGATYKPIDLPDLFIEAHAILETADRVDGKLPRGMRARVFEVFAATARGTVAADDYSAEDFASAFAKWRKAHGDQLPRELRDPDLRDL